MFAARFGKISTVYTHPSEGPAMKYPLMTVLSCLSTMRRNMHCTYMSDAMIRIANQGGSCINCYCGSCLFRGSIPHIETCIAKVYTGSVMYDTQAAKDMRKYLISIFGKCIWTPTRFCRLCIPRCISNRDLILGIPTLCHGFVIRKEIVADSIVTTVSFSRLSPMFSVMAFLPVTPGCMHCLLVVTVCIYWI